MSSMWEFDEHEDRDAINDRMVHIYERAVNISTRYPQVRVLLNIPHTISDADLEAMYPDIHMEDFQ